MTIQEQCVYFIAEVGSGDECHVKIGWAKDALKRLANLQTAHRHELEIVRLLRGCKADEATLHRRYKSRRLRGEWFRFTADMLTEDFGLPDLPIPQSARRPLPDTDEARREVFQKAWATIGAVRAAGGSERQITNAWLRVIADGAPTVTFKHVINANGDSVPLVVRVPPPTDNDIQVTSTDLARHWQSVPGMEPDLPTRRAKAPAKAAPVLA